MEVYLLKSAVCLVILFSFYKVFLEKENMHTFKRFYLLGIVLVSFGIPLLTFTSYIEASDIAASKLLINTTETLASETNSLLVYLPTVLWSIYAIGVLIFSIRFGKNLWAILLRIKQNQKIKINSIINVLLFDAVIPHTFFNYIFLNKIKFEAQEIPEEVLVHEQTHAQQKHSIDILFIELLQIIFWFNPFIYFIKYSIKLNHEFLADKAVLKKGITTANYQDILLAFSSNAPVNNLANSINYSLIKKRFTVMKTHTSKKKIWLRSLILMPLLAVLIFSFSSREEIERDIYTLNEVTLQKGATKEQIKEYNTLAKKYNAMSKDNMRIKAKDISRIKYLYNLMTSKQQKNAAPFPNFPPPPPSPAPIDESAPKAPAATELKVVKEVKGIKSDIPTPTTSVSPELQKVKLREIKEKEKANKTKQENLVLRSEKLDRKKEDLELKRIALLVIKEKDRYKKRKLEHEKVYLERIEERNEIRLKRIEEREKENDKRKVFMEERKDYQKKRLIETEKRKLKQVERQLEDEKKSKKNLDKQK